MFNQKLIVILERHLFIFLYFWNLEIQILYN